MIRLPVKGGGVYELAPSKIICLGLNYRSHVEESAGILSDRPAPEEPREPILFAKTPNVLVGDGEAIVLPAIVAAYGFPAPRVDHEAELAVVIGKRMKDVAPEEALSFVLGYTCFNDVSQRDIQNLDRSGWFRGKSFDTFGPVGPVLVPAALIPDPQALRVSCRVNGRVTQDGPASAMIFTVAEALSFISRNLTLEPGDLVATGTPAGVGPIVPGDVVEVEISGIGVLRNTVKAD